MDFTTRHFVAKLESHCILPVCVCISCIAVHAMGRGLRRRSTNTAGMLHEFTLLLAENWGNLDKSAIVRRCEQHEIYSHHTCFSVIQFISKLNTLPYLFPSLLDTIMRGSVCSLLCIAALSNSTVAL